MKRRTKVAAPSARARLAAKAAMWDALCARMISVKVRYPCGRVAVESDDPRRVAALLEQVLGVLDTSDTAARIGAGAA